LQNNYSIGRWRKNTSGGRSRCFLKIDWIAFRDRVNCTGFRWRSSNTSVALLWNFSRPLCFWCTYALLYRGVDWCGHHGSDLLKVEMSRCMNWRTSRPSTRCDPRALNVRQNVSQFWNNKLTTNGTAVTCS